MANVSCAPGLNRASVVNASTVVSPVGTQQPIIVGCTSGTLSNHSFTRLTPADSQPNCTHKFAPFDFFSQSTSESDGAEHGAVGLYTPWSSIPVVGTVAPYAYD